MLAASLSAVPPVAAETGEGKTAGHPFDKGSRLWSITAGASRDHSLGEIYLTQFNISHYLVDNLAFHYGASFGYADVQRAHDGFQGGPEFGLRWHVFRSERWSLYAEGLAAAIVHRHPLTLNSLRFNFDLQPGGGLTYRFNEDTMFETGFRWHHLSNARIRGKERNLGYDGPMVYIGLKKSF